jgi:RNA polymerase sigma-70 factor (ECF subfamily)
MVTEERDLAEIFRSTHDRILVSAFALTGDLAEAQDVVQEAFVRAVVHKAKVLAADSPEAWLRRVTRNVAISRWRRVRHRAQLLDRSGLRPAAVPEPTPDRVAMLEAVKQLPRGQREAIALHYLADLSVEQIAQTLAVSTGTVKSRLSRGRTALAAVLGESRGAALEEIGEIA